MQLSIRLPIPVNTASRSGHARSPTMLIATFVAWSSNIARRSRERAELARLGAREMQDLGHARVLDELSKPFWRE